jgi:hypothetical protein
MKKRALLVMALAMLSVAAAAGPALAAGFTLALAAPPAIVGKPIVLTATGTIPVDELQFPYWFSLDAIPTAVMTTCPPDRWEGAQIADATGAVIVLSQREPPDAAGRFTIPVALTPTAPGSLLLCGYTDDGLTNTLAGAALLLDISSRAAPSPPAQLRQAIRSCHRLRHGAGEKRCVRHAVARAKARCRRYPSHRRQSRCLRNVRRVAAARSHGGA